MSGFAITIRAFLPCGKTSAELARAADRIKALGLLLESDGFTAVEVVDDFMKQTPKRVRMHAFKDDATEFAEVDEAPAPQPDASEMPEHLRRTRQTAAE